MFEKILIANRGEVAARVARTCRRIGADTVAVHADGEEDAVHVQACDAAVRVGPAAIAESYRNVAALIAAAKESGCQAIHPGYGIGEDDPRLSRACEREQIAFVGPSPELLVLCRDRVSVRNAAFDAGLRILAGSERPIREPDQLRADAEALGYPLLVKPAFGAGEASSAVVIESAAELEPAIAKIAWDGCAQYVERHVDRPRLVDVHVVGDGRGNAVVVGDCEVSVRKDHRRVLAESPAPAIDQLHRGDAVRSAIWAAALDFTLSLAYRGVGSAQFLLDARGHFHFLGFHAGLGPEHAAIEMCANIDLVEIEVRLALGEELPKEAVRAEPTGHAVQARIEAASNPQDG